MRASKLCSIVLILALSGCMEWRAGYTEYCPVKLREINDKGKTSISYSITVRASQENVFAAPTLETMQKKVSAALNETGLFSSVVYSQDVPEGGYHVSFVFQRGGMTTDQLMVTGHFARELLCLVPICEVATFDGEAMLAMDGKPIYATAKAEERKCLMWLPVLPIGIFANAWTAWSEIETTIVNALANDLSEVISLNDASSRR